jgi:hypothetical protein
MWSVSMSVLQKIQAPFLAPKKPNATPLQQSRERVLAANLFIVMALGSLGYGVFLVSDIIRGFNDPSYWAEIPFNTIGFGMLCAIAFLRRLPYTLRAGGLVFAFAIIALSDKFQAGLGGLGQLLILVNVVLMSLFFGWRGSIVSIVVGFISMALPGWLMVTGQIVGRTTPLSERDPAAWIMTTLVVMILSLMLAVSIMSVLDTSSNETDD